MSGCQRRAEARPTFGARKVPFTPEYVGFSIDPQSVIGYGLDSAEKYRNIPAVQVLSD
ncbi:MAG TPA: hypothetical protein VND45_02110 [Thermoanaerobaculia bacterium]|jgi:hypoxanthine phosphoribosyltransferase|nr:hypothetical protein [Thermoanaerobaculia bacterium]